MIMNKDILNGMKSFYAINPLWSSERTPNEETTEYEIPVVPISLGEGFEKDFESSATDDWTLRKYVSFYLAPYRVRNAAVILMIGKPEEISISSFETVNHSCEYGVTITTFDQSCGLSENLGDRKFMVATLADKKITQFTQELIAIRCFMNVLSECWNSPGFKLSLDTRKSLCYVIKDITDHPESSPVYDHSVLNEWKNVTNSFYSNKMVGVSGE